MPYANPTYDTVGMRGNSAFLTQAQQDAANRAAAAPPAPTAGGATPAPATPAPGQFPNSNPIMENPSLQQYGFLDPNAWQNWGTFGGSNPNDWQNLSQTLGTGFLNMGNWTQGNVDPTQVSATTPDSMAAAMQPYEDVAYQQATRQLDPQYEAAQKQFDQQMINQGLAPGSEAYNTAKAAFDQQKNDAYSQARAQAMQQGLAAQGQAFGQGLSQSQLANQLAGQLIGANTSTNNTMLGGNQALANALLSGNNSLFNQLIGGNTSIVGNQLGAQASMSNARSAAGASRYGAELQHDLGQQNIDNGMLMNLLGLGSGVTQYNNGLLGYDQNRQTQMFGYMPNGGAGNIDVQNPFNTQYNGQMANYGYNQQQSNANNQAYMQFLMAMFGS